jgi:hypothetical protein
MLWRKTTSDPSSASQWRATSSVSDPVPDATALPALPALDPVSDSAEPDPAPAPVQSLQQLGPSQNTSPDLLGDQCSRAVRYVTMDRSDTIYSLAAHREQFHDVCDVGWVLFGQRSGGYGDSWLMDCVMELSAQQDAKEMLTLMQTQPALVRAQDRMMMNHIKEFCKHVSDNKFPMQPFIAWQWAQGHQVQLCNSMTVDASSVHKCAKAAMGIVKDTLRSCGFISPTFNVFVTGTTQSDKNILLAEQYNPNDFKPCDVCLYSANQHFMSTVKLEEEEMYKVSWCDCMWFDAGIVQPRGLTSYNSKLRRLQSGACYLVDKDWSEVFIIDYMVPSVIAKRGNLQMKDFTVKAVTAKAFVKNGAWTLQGSFSYAYLGPDRVNQESCFRLGKYIVKKVLMTKTGNTCHS